MQKRILLFIILIIPFTFSYGQEAIPPPKDPGLQTTLYRNELAFGLVAHTGGFGLNFRRGKNVTAVRKRVLEFEFVNMRHAKEVKVLTQYESSKGFYFGKLNTFQILRGGLGIQKIIYSKADGKGVEIRYISMLGGSLGLVKPVYLEIIKEYQSPNGPILQVLSTEKYDPEQHSINEIFGRGPYFKGYNELKLYPGGFAKLGLSVEYGTYDDDVKAIETGICVDVYPKVVPLMAFSRNQQVFVSFYINLLYGRKWY